MEQSEMNDEYFSSINEVSVRLGLPAHTLRYWEKQFPAAIKPTTGAGGRRYYRPETVQALGAIKDLLYNRGMTIAGVKKIIKNGELDASVEAGSTLTRGVREARGVENKNEFLQRHCAPSGGTPLARRESARDESEIASAIELLENAAAMLAS